MIRRDPDHPAVRSTPAGPPGFDESWPELAPAFQQCLALAWESTCAGSLGVGSVISDDGGAVVATGRNRLFEVDGEEDPLAGSPVAHAEMNALAKLRAGGEHASLVLWTSLAPCLLCTGGARIARVGSVRYLAEDPLWSHLDHLPGLHPHLADGWPERDGPREGPFAAFALLLPMHAVRFWNPDAPTGQVWREHAPGLAELATDLVETHELAALAASRAPLDEVLSELWPRLESVST